MTTTVTDGLRDSVVEAASFTPFGQRRLDDRSFTTLTSSAVVRGFTGHESLVELELIHMNGRVYDPITGRFLSPDPFIQSPVSSQSYNRYSYTWNNPLTLTDPSGYLAASASNVLSSTYIPNSIDFNWLWSSVNHISYGINDWKNNIAEAFQVNPDASGIVLNGDLTSSGPDLPSAIHLSGCIYSDDCKRVFGYEKQNQIMSDPEIFEDVESGFYSGLFQNQQKGDSVVAFRGTEIFDIRLRDLTHDITQMFGFGSAQYKQAKAVALSVEMELGSGESLWFTGHSLGGGLASVAALATQRPAITLNAAGVHQNTLKKLGLSGTNASNLIDAHYTSGEIVSLYQDFFGPTALGQRISHSPSAIGLITTPLGLHSMSEVRRGMLPE